MMRRFPSCLVGLLLGVSSRVDAQAFTPDKGLFSLTSLYQVVDILKTPGMGTVSEDSYIFTLQSLNYKIGNNPSVV